MDYKNPYLNPYQEFQKFKTHPEIRKHLEGGTCVEYGAWALNEGGYHSIPRMSFPGGLIAGCSAGFMNVARIKGAHTAMKSGIVAAETIFDNVSKNDVNFLEGKCLDDFDKNIHSSWIVDDLKPYRNF